jgi:cysteine desulfurase
MSVSGHKIHGPKGVGFLYVRDGVKIRPILFGGGQQKGMRSGTENVPGIAGLGAAVNKIYENHAEKREKLYQLKKALIEGLSQYDGVTIHGIEGVSLEETAPHIVSAGFASVKSEVMLHALAQEGVFVSSGSACSSNHPELSGTLQAVGVSNDLLDSTLRFSFSVMTTTEQIDYAVAAVGKVLPVLRRFTRQ